MKNFTFLGQDSLMDKIMAEEDHKNSNTHIGIINSQILKSSTGEYEKNDRHGNDESYQYTDEKRERGGNGFIYNGSSNNNRGMTIIIWL